MNRKEQCRGQPVVTGAAPRFSNREKASAGDNAQNSPHEVYTSVSI